MKLIRNARVYKATIPASSTLLEHLATGLFRQPLSLEAGTAGFVDVPDQGLVVDFTGGFAFAVRIDEKIIPGSAVTAEVNRRADERKKEFGRKLGKKERAELKEFVILEFRARALIRTAIITSYYHPETGFLIVGTTSKRFSDIVVSRLVEAVGSVKTETIHVSNVKHGLTSRLKNWLGDKTGEFSYLDAFGTFTPIDEVALKNNGQTITFKLDALESAAEGLGEAMKRGFDVTSIRLAQPGIDFRLTHDFQFKGITFPPLFSDDVDAGSVWAHEASCQVLQLTTALTELCEMFSYREDAAAEGAEGEAA